MLVSKMLPVALMWGEVPYNHPLTSSNTLGSEEPLKGVWIIYGLPLLEAYSCRNALLWDTPSPMHTHLRDPVLLLHSRAPGVKESHIL